MLTRPMIRRLGLRFAAFFRATTPDPFVLAIGLTLVVFVLAALVEGKGPVEIVDAWQGSKGYWSLLAFAMQMVLILVTGHAMTSAPIARRALRRIAQWPKSGSGAVALVSAVAMAMALLNWGLGLIVGAILARDVGRHCHARGIRVHYPLLAAAGYTGLLCWHGGMSGTAPLKMSTAADVEKFLGAELAKTVEPIPFTETVLGLENIVVSGGLLVLVPLLCMALCPKDDDPVQSIEEFDPREEDTSDDPAPETIPEKIEQSRWLTVVLVVMLGAAVWRWLDQKGIGKLDPNALNLMFLTVGLALHGTVKRYVRAVGEAVRGASGIVLQFPFYAGIMGVVRTTGLAATFSSSMAAIVPAKLFAVTTMFSAAVVNLFVPSGGGQWAVQGPISVEAALRLGVEPKLAVMAVAYGDQLTNMLQPFWALPLLAITGVKARDLIGYTAVLMLAAAVWIGACLIVLSA